MKIVFIILFVCTALTGISQDKSVTWDVTAKKISDTTYTIIISGSIQQDWYVYGADDKKEGVEAVRLEWENERIMMKGNLEAKMLLEIIDDKVFGNKEKVYRNAVIFTQNITVRKPVPYSFKLNIQAYAANGKEFLPIEETAEVELEGGVALNTENKIKLAAIDLIHPIADCGNRQHDDKGILAIFFLGFGGGLLALLTPCVFPMIPVTVSFFTGLGNTRRQGLLNGFVYGLSILLIYLLASVPFHLLGNVNPQIFNTISTSAGVNVFFFAVFIVFALSFFGLFELRIPGSAATKADNKSGTGSFAGIFFMALTLAIVSFSCTGPILGSLLVGSLSSEGGAWQLTAGLGGFGLALALPFALFAMFPQWMKALPKSGGWLDTFKKSLAFIELALAVKFLSNADLVEHWGILKRELFIGIWLIISLGLALYLFGAFAKRKSVYPVWQSNNIKHGKQIAWPRKSFGIAVLLFAFYLVPGLTQSAYANLKLLSGFAPPLSYSIYGKGNVQGKGVEPDVINDYEKALAMAKAQNKPLLIDFTGWACVNCRKMEEQVWTKAVISELIKDKFILVSLYVDDRRKLPAEQRFTYKDAEGNEKDIKTVGDKWATLEAENFKQVSQPLYVILSGNEMLLNNPVGYTPDEDKYKEWLECGLAAYKQ